MAAAQVRQSCVVVVKGFAFFAATVAVWHVVLAINIRTTPVFPWFVVLDAGFLYWAGRILHRRNLLGDRCGHRDTPRSVLFGILVVTASLAIAIIQGSIGGLQLGPLERIADVSPFFSTSAIVALPLYAAIAEELGFRGIVQTSLEPIVGVGIAIAITTALFSTVHAQNPLFGQQWAFYLSLSIALGLVAVICKSLTLCMALHAGLNGLSVVTTLYFGPIYLGELGGVARTMLGGVAIGCVAGAIYVAKIISCDAIE